MRSMVEGAHLRGTRDDVAKHGVQVAKHVSRSDPNHAETVPLEQRVASNIASRLIAQAVSFAVHLDDEPVAQAREIRGDAIIGELAAPLEPAGTLPQLAPEQHFRQAHLPA